jgi:hypothetical protein
MSALSYKEQKQQKQKESAHHEAGHIFMLSFFGYTVTDASIDEEIDEGETNYTPRIDPAFLTDTLDKHVAACIAIAGVVSEARFRGLPDSSALLLEGGLSDLVQFKQVSASIDFLGPIINFTEQILEENKDIVSKIADELYESKILTHEKIENLLNFVDLTKENKKYKSELINIEPDPKFFSK